jgi:phage-related protein
LGSGFKRYAFTEFEHRILYLTRLKDAVYILHAFEKKTRKTAKADLDLARSRLKEVLNTRRAARRSWNTE